MVQNKILDGPMNDWKLEVVCRSSMVGNVLFHLPGTIYPSPAMSCNDIPRYHSIYLGRQRSRHVLAGCCRQCSQFFSRLFGYSRINESNTFTWLQSPKSRHRGGIS